MRASEIIRIRRSRVPLRMPKIEGTRIWETRLLQRGVWAARALQFGCPREFRRYLKTPSERAAELGVTEAVLTRFVSSTDTPVLTADYILFGPHRWYVASCRRLEATGLPRQADDDAASLSVGRVLYAEHVFELAVFDLYAQRNALGLSDREIYLMVQKLTGALGAVAAETERQRLRGPRQKQFALTKVPTMRKAKCAGDLRTVESIYGEISDLFERELCSISDEMNRSAYPDCDGSIGVDYDAMLAIVETFAAMPSRRGPRRKVSALHGIELLKEHYCQLTGQHRETISGDFGLFIAAIFEHFQVAVPGADIGRVRTRKG